MRWGRKGREREGGEGRGKKGGEEKRGEDRAGKLKEQELGGVCVMVFGGMDAPDPNDVTSISLYFTLPP
jgi:hypothetical protein